MKNKLLLVVPLLFATQFTSAQVLYTENFDNLTLGNLGTDFTGSTPGQGEWHTQSKALTVPADAGNNYFKIVSEPNKGKVLQTTALQSVGSNNIQKRGLGVLWANRAAGNNVLKIEYEFFTGPHLNITAQNHGLYILSNNDFVGTNNTLIHYLLYKPAGTYTLRPNTVLISPQTYPQLQNNTWYTFIFYIDYTNQKSYFEIPAVGLKTVYDQQTPIPLPSSLLFSHSTGPNQTVKSDYKYDNFTISAIPNVPLTTENFISDKFNLYPNPAKNIVNITNTENIEVEKIIIFDVNGKLIDTKIFNKQSKVQLNVATFAAGTYLLHIYTANGIGVKKVIKK